MRRTPCLAALLSSCLAVPALAQEPAPIVVTAPGGGADLDDAIALDRDAVWRGGAPDLRAALAREVAGVSLQDAQGNRWQPNLVYRGFTASPLQGQAQGLAVYLDGGRFNQPFGDTVAFDLIPEAALRSADLLDASPVYGLNALGGALVLTTATGRGDPGLRAALSAGQHGERGASIAGGGASGALSWFGAVQHDREDGWRDFSPSRLTRGYADLGFDTARGGLHLKLLGGDTDLTGNGVAPVELLAARRAAVFTWPDRSEARFGRASLHPWLDLSDATRLEATLYTQHLRLDTVNGDAADIEPCEAEPGLLCLETVGADGDEDAALLTDAAGQPIAAFAGVAAYGVRNIGALRSAAQGLLVQVIDRRALPGGTNQLGLGFSYDTSRNRFAAATTLGALNAARGVDPLGPRIVQADGAITPVALTAHTDYWGVFAQDRLPITDRLSAEIALRHNSARVRLVDGIGTALNGDHRFARLNPGIEFDLALRPGVTLRAGYAETNRAPTPAELSCADEAAPCSLANFFVADPPLRQVVARTFELGGSGQLVAGGWTLDWLASAWRTTSSDDIQHVASAIRGRAWFRNIGRTRRQGVELGLKARRGALRLAASYAFNDARFLDPLVLSSPANPLADAAGTITVLPGSQLPGVPRHSATLAVDYAGTLPGGRGFTLGGEVIARGGQWLVGDEANANAPVPGYAVVNLRASVDMVAGVALFGELRNAFDRQYATFGTFSEVGELDLAEAPGASDPRAYGPAAPRRWSVGLRAAF